MRFARRTTLVTGVLLFATGLFLSPAVSRTPDALSAPRVVLPPVGTDFDYQLGGVRSVPSRVGTVVRDRRAAPLPGRYSICYVNGFQTQPGERALWRRHPHLVLRRGGLPVHDPGWPDEWLLDLRTPAKRRQIVRIMDRWLARCAADGYAGVEFDNLDSPSRSGGLLRWRDATAHARLLVAAAHRHGLAAAQKNRAGWNGTRVGYDFAIAESCARWRECGAYRKHYGRRVLAVEYDARSFRRACRGAGRRIPVVLRDRALAADGRRAWCRRSGTRAGSDHP